MITLRAGDINTARLALLGYVLARGLLLVGLIPPWQGPDEPGHLEYALVISERSAALMGWRTGTDADPGTAFQAPIIRSMREHAFFRHTASTVPPTASARFEDVERLGTEVAQRGDETPIGYVPYVAALALFPDGDIAEVLRRLRLVSVALVLVLVWLSWGVAARVLPRRAAPAAAALVMAGPMVGFAGAVVSPDMAAAVLAAVWLAVIARRMVRDEEVGDSEQRSSGAAWMVALLAAAAKRTTLFVLPLMILFEWTMRVSRSRTTPSPPSMGVRFHRLAPRASAGLALWLVIVVAVVSAALSPRGGQAAGWGVAGASWGDVRSEEARFEGQMGLRVVDEAPRAWQYIEQHVAAKGARQVEASVWMRSAMPSVGPDAPAARASLVVEDGARTWLADLVALPGDGTWVEASVEGQLAPNVETIRIAIVPGDGTVEGVGVLDADRATLVLDGRMVDVNGGAERPNRRGTDWLEGLGRYTAAERLLSATAVGLRDPRGALERGTSALGFTFRSAWGGFGWLTLWPGRLHYVLAALLTCAAALGCGAALTAPGWLSDDPERARFLRLCAIGALLALAIAIVGSVAGAAPHKQPQGRYLIPALLPVVLPTVAFAERVLPGHGPLVLAALAIGLDLAALGWVVWPGFG